MFVRAGNAFVRANKRVLKPRACLTSRRDGPMRIIRTTLKMVGENGNTMTESERICKIIPFKLV